jgi:hypothetical protein
MQLSMTRIIIYAYKFHGSLMTDCVIDNQTIGLWSRRYILPTTIIFS